ncbi:MAG: DUF1801 domain-containing protein [Ferruginibacter sp.]
MATTKPGTIDGYIAEFPKPAQIALEEIRAAIKKEVPEAEETISYSIPTFKLNGQYLVYFAAYKNHIGFYPVPTGNSIFEKEFSAYKTTGKGAIQFPLDKQMPLRLIVKIVKFRIKENLKKIAANPKKEK